MGPCKNVNRIIKIKKYRKIPKISPGAYIFQRPFLRGIYVRRGLSTEGGGGSYFEARFNGGFFALQGWEAYIWRGLFSEFYGTLTTIKNSLLSIYKSKI